MTAECGLRIGWRVWGCPRKDEKGLTDVAFLRHAERMIDPFTVATILQLVGVFRAERSSRMEAEGMADLKTFLEWLNNRKFADLTTLINERSDVMAEVSELLHDDHEAIRSNLSELNRICLGIAKNMDALSGFAGSAMVGEAMLSEQALQILTLFVESGGSRFCLLIGSGDVGFLEVPDGKSFKRIAPGELRYLEDDIESLVAAEFLLVDYSSQSGEKFYRIRRSAEEFVKKLDRSAIFPDK